MIVIKKKNSICKNEAIEWLVNDLWLIRRKK